MAGTISESFVSRSFTVGSGAVRELIWNVWGTEDEDDVQTLVVAVAPATYKGLVLQSVSAENSGGGVWKGSARYARLETQYSFDTGGGTSKITQSLGTVNSYAPAGQTAPDFQGAVNVSEDKIEGVDVPSYAFQFAVTKVFESATVSVAYQDMIAAYCAGTYNNGTFTGRAAGTVSLQRCSGSTSDDGRVTLTFTFAVSPNATGLTIGDITGIDKLGWDYLWVRYAEFADTSANALVKRPVAVYVERVFTPADYSLLLLGI